ncbi:PREDICTED: phospholipase A(1) LCAT3 [Tarenaya hassleriana]|uniref:phospholipase A(1) LCAT3 n=1 Tax=Tarenaya hassleriana TaxID=28532 RepID=UPI00053C23F1|nr:PREDICTED: phospholipase A(1) LCAT3 [Tarenaya hassleriana]
MLKDWVSCPCWGDHDGDDGEAADREPVLLVSGIGGSILHSRKKKKPGSEIRVWVRIFLANLAFKQNLWSLYNPKTGYTEPLDDDIEILVPDDDFGLYAIDILDPSWFVKLFNLVDLYHFHDMIEMLVGCGYKKGATLFGYGYDFRQSNRIDTLIDGLKKKLETAYKVSGQRKVNIISHSMGGLLMSCFLSLHPELFSKYVNKWITIATPFQGAPGCINDALLTGLQFVEGLQSYFFVSRWTMHQLLVECPSIYEMMGNPDFKWRNQPKIQVWRKKMQNDDASVELESFGPAESIDLFNEALKDNELSYGGNKIALPFNLSILKWAVGTREILDKAQLPDGIPFYNIFGVSYDTPFDVRYGTETSPIEDLSEICHSTPEYRYVDGDGTVPAESAEAAQFKAVASIGVSAGHRALLSDKRVFKLIQEWLGVEPKKARRKLSRTCKVVNADSEAH